MAGSMITTLENGQRVKLDFFYSLAVTGEGKNAKPHRTTTCSIVSWPENREDVSTGVVLEDSFGPLSHSVTCNYKDQDNKEKARVAALSGLLNSVSELTKEDKQNLWLTYSNRKNRS